MDLVGYNEKVYNNIRSEYTAFLNSLGIEAREFIRILDRISKEFTLQDWIPLNGPEMGNFKIVMENDKVENDAVKIFGNKNDHKILNAALCLPLYDAIKFQGVQPSVCQFNKWHNMGRFYVQMNYNMCNN